MTTVADWVLKIKYLSFTGMTYKKCVLLTWNFHRDMTFAVHWVLKNNYLSIYPLDTASRAHRNYHFAIYESISLCTACALLEFDTDLANEMVRTTSLAKKEMLIRLDLIT